MFFLGAEEGAVRYRWVERHELAVVPDGECRQIDIRDLARTVNSREIRDARIQQARVAGPNS